MSVLVFGSLNLDLVAYAQTLPVMGETLIGEKLMRFPGGKGLNQAIAAKRAGSNVAMVGCIGEDGEGNFLMQVLSQEQIETSFVSSSPIATGIALIEVSAEGNNRILVIPGANDELKFKSEILSGARKPKVCLAQLEVPLVEATKFLGVAQRQGCITILNPAPIQSLDSELIGFIDYLIVNETEASFLAGSKSEVLTQDEARLIGTKLILNGWKRVIITLAERGSLYFDGHSKIYTPALEVKAIDTTAAGDAFCGALASALAEEKPIDYCLKFASAAGGLSVTRAGAVPSLPNRQEILSMSSIS
ncbi:MAG: ribokinase [Actinomycetota bacterium]|nr:ribokinase [Actinomycetota bacterium]